MTLLPDLERALGAAIGREVSPHGRVAIRARRRINLAVAALGVAASVTGIATATGLLGERSPAPRATVRLQVAGSDRQVSFADYRGKPLVVTFWASWCGPCREQASIADDLGREMRRAGAGEVVLVDVPQDRPDLALNAVRDLGFALPLLLDPEGEVADAYGLSGVPQTFVLDADGDIAYVAKGTISLEALRAGVARAADPEGPGPVAPTDPSQPGDTFRR